MNLRKKSLQGLLIAVALVLLATCIPTNAQADTYGDFVYTTMGNQLTITDYVGTETGHLTIPAKIDGKFVTAIGQGAFTDSSFSGVTIPDRVVSIGTDAFRGCHNLTAVGLPQLLTTVGDNAFAECSALTKSVYCNKHWESNVTVGAGNTALTAGRQQHDFSADATVCSYCKHRDGFAYGKIIKDGREMIAIISYSGNQQILEIPAFYEGKQVQAIKENAFSRNTAIKQIILPEGFLYIGDNAFFECRSLEQINFFDTIYYIGTAAFRYSGLKKASLPGGLNAVCDWSFAGTKVEEVTVPAGVKSIGAYAFENCDSLTTVYLTTGLETIGERAFNGCGNLVNITFPNGLHAIGKNAFEACGIKSVSLPDSLTELGMYAFDTCGSLKSVRLPAGLTVLGGWVFDGCTALESITLPENLTAIGNGAFSNTGLEAITIPAKVETIGEQAFINCKSLKQVNLKPGLISVGRQAFSGCIALEKAVYCGTRMQWDAVTVDTENTLMTGMLRMHDLISGECAVCHDTLVSYVVKFKNWDGSIISEDKYLLGDKIQAPGTPTRADDNLYTYTFAGWDKKVANCDGEATYTATYIAIRRTYQVTFLNWDGSVISAEEYVWDTRITVPANPTRPDADGYTYTFAGWDKDVERSCAGDATYTARYNTAKKSYTVTFKNWDGTVLSTATYYYGDTVKAPANPTRPDADGYTYTFSGWDKTVTACVGDATYTARYTETKKDPIYKDCTDIVLNMEAVVLEQAGAEVTITVTVSPGDTDDVVTFRSENPAVATVDENGRITAVSSGTTKIFVTCGTVRKECTVVCDIPADLTEPTDTTEPSEPHRDMGMKTSHKRLLGVLIILLASCLGFAICVISLHQNRDIDD